LSIAPGARTQELGFKSSVADVDIEVGITPKRLRISEVSIAKFKKKYLPLASIAREIGSNATALMQHCVWNHIPMVVVKYRYGKSKQAFIRIRDRDAVLSFRPRNVKRRDFGGLSLFPDLETVEQWPKQSSRPSTARVKRRDLGPSLFPDLETIEQLPKRASKSINSLGCGTPA
jgi:hypothetical protein